MVGVAGRRWNYEDEVQGLGTWRARVFSEQMPALQGRTRLGRRDPSTHPSTPSRSIISPITRVSTESARPEPIDCSTSKGTGIEQANLDRCCLLQWPLALANDEQQFADVAFSLKDGEDTACQYNGISNKRPHDLARKI